MNTTATKTANPPAFPRPASVEKDWRELEADETVVGAQDGLSMRDWFAGHALSALLIRGDAGAPEVLAEAAYRAADAMLAKRAEGT